MSAALYTVGCLNIAFGLKNIQEGDYFLAFSQLFSAIMCLSIA
jgi:hypothetical protein